MNEWDEAHGTLTAPQRYGADDYTYAEAAEWVRGHGLVEDWGCNGGYLREWVAPSPYRGIDGSHSPYTDVLADLAGYTSTDAGGIVIRHVLEHNYEWRQILANVVISKPARLCVVLFTPLTETTRVLHTEPDYGDVPVISFAATDLERALPGWTIRWEHVRSGTQFGQETILRCHR